MLSTIGGTPIFSSSIYGQKRGGKKKTTYKNMKEKKKEKRNMKQKPMQETNHERR
jgi:hypothetical protein